MNTTRPSWFAWFLVAVANAALAAIHVAVGSYAWATFNALMALGCFVMAAKEGSE